MNLSLAQSKCIELKSLSGLHQVLKKLGISLQRARSWVHSPDPNYQAKEAYLHQCIQQGHQAGIEVCFLDEFTYSIHPILARDYAPQKQQPLAKRAIGPEKTWRIVAALNAFSGKVVYQQRAYIRVPTFVGFCQQFVKAYPYVDTLFVMVDN